jgi:hypothetical protein
MMEPEVIIGALSLAGSALGTLAGILTSSKLTNYRIKQLELKVDKHNQLVERMVAVEQSARSAHNRIDEMRKGMILHGPG